MQPADRFRERPHRTTAWLSVPVFFALVAEPIAALVDTGFVASLGADSSAALSTGTLALSSFFWIFNFIAIGAQTEVARSLGGADRAGIRRTASLALVLATGFGALLTVVIALAAPALVDGMHTPESAVTGAVDYVWIRAFGAPMVLLMSAGAGIMRGLHEMRWPMFIAIAASGANVLLDWWLIFGVGPFPALGIRGAAWATVIAQTIGALATVAIVHRRAGLTRAIVWQEARNLLVVGTDLFVRTGLLTLFLVMSTRTANEIGTGAAAVHQAIRTVWLFTALALDAYAATAQSLIGFFRGANDPRGMRTVAGVACTQCTAFGVVLALVMWAATGPTRDWLVPVEAHGEFAAAWLVAAASQPLNALAFATDGIHWGTADFRYLRRAMVVSSSVGVAALFLVAPAAEGALATVWGVTAGWVAIRAAFGVFRIWPGSGPWRRG